MARTPNARPTYCPMTMPPRAGDRTVWAFKSRTLSAISSPQASASRGCWRTSAHCMKPELCSPEVSRKCPSSRAPTRRNRFRTESTLIDAIFGEYTFCTARTSGCGRSSYKGFREYGAPSRVGRVLLLRRGIVSKSGVRKMGTTVTRVGVAALLMAVFGTSASVFAQAPQPSQQPAAAPALSRRLTADEAVKLALENNLGIRVARIDPQVQDLNIVNAKTGWTPNFSTTIQTQSNDAPNQNFLAGGQGTRTESDQFAGNIGIAQTLPWGGNYDIGWDSSRFNSNSSFSTFSPQLRSSFAVNYSQPLLRNWKIDNTRQQVLITSKNREIADVSVRQTVATTTRNVRNAFWDLAYTIASLGVQQQSLDLAQESLRDTRARVEIGTTPPIDIVQAEAEVARRREAVIVAEGQIGDAEDALRALIFDPNMPDFWTIKIEPTDLPAFQPITVDVDAAVRNALSRRTDLEQSRKSIEADDINVRFYRNQMLPD